MSPGKEEFLVHFTNSIDTVASICTHGFLLIPNKRELISDFLGTERFHSREPQQFGMVCFTELGPHDIKKHADRYGQFGIAVSWQWAKRHSVDRVIYVRLEGPLFETLKYMFCLAKADLDGRMKHPDDGAWQMAYTNADVASGIAGSPLYSAMLRLYEFMQPERDKDEREWRIVQRLPIYMRSKSKRGMIEEALAVTRTWKLHNLSIEQDEIEFFVCPMGEEEMLRAGLPEWFRSCPVRGYPCL